MSTTLSLNAYREQIRHYAQTMAVGKNDGASAGLRSGMKPSQVELFTSGNLAKRYEKLQSACEMLADGLEGLAEFIDEYIQVVPLTAYDSGAEDAERFLEWLGRRVDLSDEQQDYVRLQRGRHAVEFVAVKQRLAHVRFQERLSVRELLVGDLERNQKLCVYLNPIHIWSRFETSALLEDDQSPPATVIFFPVGNDIRTAVLEDDGERLVRLLEQGGQMRVKDLRRLWTDSESNIFALLRDLIELGLVTVG